MNFFSLIQRAMTTANNVNADRLSGDDAYKQSVIAYLTQKESMVPPAAEVVTLEPTLITG